MTEIELKDLIVCWRDAEESAKTYASVSEIAKTRVLEGMHELGLKSQSSEVGTVTLSKSTKTNIVVKRKDFEEKLKREGMFDRFCVTKFDLDEVKKYVEEQDDDLFGMVEIEKTYVTRFTPAKGAMPAKAETEAID